MKSYFVLSLLIFGALVVCTLARDRQGDKFHFKKPFIVPAGQTRNPNVNVVERNPSRDSARQNLRPQQASDYIQQKERDYNQILRKYHGLRARGNHREAAKVKQQLEHLRNDLNWPTSRLHIEYPSFGRN